MPAASPRRQASPEEITLTSARTTKRQRALGGGLGSVHGHLGSGLAGYEKETVVKDMEAHGEQRGRPVEEGADRRPPRRVGSGGEGFSTGGLSACSSSSCRLVSTLKKSTFLLLHKTNTSSMSKLKCLNLKYYVFESIQNISSESKIS